MLLPAFSTDPYHMRISGGIYGMVSQGGDPDSIFNQVTGSSPPRPKLRRSVTAPARRATAQSQGVCRCTPPRGRAPARRSWLGAAPAQSSADETLRAPLQSLPQFDPPPATLAFSNDPYHMR